MLGEAKGVGREARRREKRESCPKSPNCADHGGKDDLLNPISESGTTLIRGGVGLIG